MASIKANKDQHGNIISYRFRACVGRDEQYNQVWRTCTLPRPEGLTPAKERKEIERQADAWELSQKAEYERSHQKTTMDKITFRQFVNEHWWPDHVLDGTHSPSSVSFYGFMKDDILSYFGTKKLRTIDAEAVKRYLKYLNTKATTQSGKPYSATTIQHHFATLRNIMQYARRFHYIDADPCQDLAQKEKPHRDKRKVDFLTPQEARAFIQCLEKEPLSFRCLATVLITTGLRRGEAVGLQWGDIDPEKLTIRVQRNVTIDTEAESKIHIGTTKTGEERTVPITERVYQLLMSYKQEQEAKFQAALFPTAFIFCADLDPYRPMYPSTPTRLVSKFVKKNHLRNISPHDLRHTAATLALDSGADLKQVQELLGHADASTTMQFYAGVTDEAKRRTVDGIESILSAQ